MFSSLYLTISAISRVVAKLSTDHSVAITLFEPAARNAAARPLRGGDCGDLLAPVLQADKITKSALSSICKISSIDRKPLEILSLLFFGVRAKPGSEYSSISPFASPCVEKDMTAACLSFGFDITFILVAFSRSKSVVSEKIFDFENVINSSSVSGSCGSLERLSADLVGEFWKKLKEGLVSPVFPLKSGSPTPKNV